MSKRRQTRAAPAQPAQTGDSFANFAARTGVSQANLSKSSGYSQDYVSRNRQQMEAVYRTSWIAGQAVDTVAEDMTRDGIDIHSDVPPDDLEKLQRAADDLGIWNALADTVKWSRLYGGAIAVLLIDGQKVETPLDVERIGKGQFRGLMVLDRWVLNPSLQNLITDLGPDYGKPKFYDVIADAQGLVSQRIHHSRVIRMDGVDLPYWQRIAENGWGQSVLERLWDRLLAFDSTTQGAAQLIFKAHLRTYSVEGLRDIIAAGGPAMAGLVKQIELVRLYQSNEGMTLMDAKDKFEAHQYSFSGLADMMLQFGQQISGALQIPLVRLFGQSPAGMNSTGESDLRTYYDGIRQQQERRLRVGVGRIYDILHRSVFGRAVPDNLDFTFKPLWQLKTEEKATVNAQNTEAVVKAFDAGLIDRATALKELRQTSNTTGAWSNVTDEIIEEAENEPPPLMAEMEMPNGQAGEEGQEPQSGANPGGGKDVRGAAAQGGAPGRDAD